MVKIPTARKRIQQPSLGAGTQFVAAPRDFASGATAGLGRAISNFGQQIGAAAQQMEVRQKQDQVKITRAQRFETNRKLLEFQQQQTLALRDLQERSPEGGFGYTQTVTNNYQAGAKSFFKDVPEELKPEFDAKLASLESEFVLQADKFETKSRQDYYARGIENGLNQLRNNILSGTTDYNKALQEGNNLIGSADIDQTSKQKFADSWRKDLAAAEWRKEYDKDPAKALVAIGGGTPQQRVKYQQDNLFAAMVAAESGGNPNAVSPVGAAGIMQVMPDTARYIAKQIKDPNFPKKGSNREVQEYLKNPDTGMRYGQYYMTQQLDKYNGDVEAALIAYNAGPANADKWLKADRNYAVLPKRKETEPYVRKIMGQMGAQPVAQHTYNKNYVNAGSFRSRNYQWSDLRNDRFRDAKMDQGAVSALDDVTDAFGKGKLRITSGYRSHAYNTKVSFSKKSRHSEGDAIDIDVTGYTDQEKARLIGLFVAAGARGIGHYDNGSIHIDFRQGQGKGPGGLALWYNKNRDYKEGAAWFSEGVNQGLANKGQTIARSGPVDPKYQVLDHDTRRKMMADASKQVAKQQADLREETIGSYELTMVTDPISVSQDQILQSVNDGVIDQGDAASLIKKLRTAQKDAREQADFATRLREGEEFNPFDSDDRKKMTKLWDDLGIEKDDPKYDQVAMATVRQAGIAPQPVVNNMRADIVSNDPSRVAQSMNLAAQMMDRKPQAFAGAKGGADITKALAEYRHFTDLGYTPEQSAQQMLEARDPQQKATRKILLKDAKEVSKKFDVNTIEDVFGETLAFDPDVAYGNPVRQAKIVSEYRDIFEQEFIETGNEEIAKARANDQFKKIYGVSEFSGERNVVRYPFENYYPKVGDTHDYVKSQLIEDLSGLTDQKIDPENVVLLAQAGVTNIDIKAGKTPRYAVLYRGEDGALDTLPRVGFWRADIKKAEQDSRAAGTDRKSLIERAQLEGSGLRSKDGKHVYIEAATTAGENVIIDVDSREIMDRDDKGNLKPSGEKYDRAVIVRPNGGIYIRSLEYPESFEEVSKRRKEKQELEEFLETDDPYAGLPEAFAKPGVF